MSPKKELLLAEMLKGKSKTECAKTVGISRNTVYKYLEDEEFMTELQKRKNEMLSEVCMQMESAYSDATKELIKIINSNYSPQVKINAINSLFLNSKPLIDQVDILTRLQELEQHKKEGDEDAEYYSETIRKA